MFEAYLLPTNYNQPKPADGTYKAFVYQQHAEFEYHEFKVLAVVNPGSSMNADENNGLVTVKGDNVKITWEGSANLKNRQGLRFLQEPSHINQKQLFAALRPFKFNQKHPFKYGDEKYLGNASSTKVKFGVLEEYEAIIDGNIQVSALAAPCTVCQEGNDSLKCIIKFDDEIIFMVNRYGPSTYTDLVNKTVAELQSFVSKR